LRGFVSLKVVRCDGFWGGRLFQAVLDSYRLHYISALLLISAKDSWSISMSYRLEIEA